MWTEDGSIGRHTNTTYSGGSKLIELGIGRIESVVQKLRFQRGVETHRGNILKFLSLEMEQSVNDPVTKLVAERKTYLNTIVIKFNGLFECAHEEWRNRRFVASVQVLLHLPNSLKYEMRR